MLPSYTATVTPGPKFNERRAWLNLGAWAPLLLCPALAIPSLEQQGRTGSSIAPIKLQTLES